MGWPYLGFVTLIAALLALDLGVFHRRAHAVRVREALAWSAVWISLGLGFSVFVYLGYDHGWWGLGRRPDAMSVPHPVEGGAPVYNDGAAAALKYLTGFAIEKSLAVDNLFVIAALFGYLGVPAQYQHRVLFWGIVGALVLRGAMIFAGAALITRFDWILYVFGGFLVLTGLKMLHVGDAPADPGRSRLVRGMRRLIPVSDGFHGHRFFVRAGAGGRRALMATPLLLALVLVELSDVLFAIDSIPAIFAITTDPFLVFTSNIFAILGLRSLYFALACLIGELRYLTVALAVVLLVIGAKMVLHGWLARWFGEHVDLYALGVVAAILAAGVVASLVTRAPPAAD